MLNVSTESNGGNITLKSMILAIIKRGKLSVASTTALLDTLEGVEPGQVNAFVAHWQGFRDKPEELQTELYEFMRAAVGGGI